MVRLDDSVDNLTRRESLLRDSRASLERLLRLGTSDLDSREAEIVRLERELSEREQRLAAAEAEIARRREELGAVELKRAALERRERAVEEREVELASEDAGTPEAHTGSSVLFVPGERYRLRELELESVEPGSTIDVDGETFVVARFGPSPLPGDSRRCAYLMREPRPAASLGTGS